LLGAQLMVALRSNPRGLKNLLTNKLFN